MPKTSAVRTKQQLIDHTYSAWDDFVTHVDGLTKDQLTGPRDESGWSVKDHVAHVTRWDRAVVRRLRQNVPLEETLGISAAAWTDESFDPMNEEMRRQVSADAIDRVRADRDAVGTEVVSHLEDLSDAQLARSGKEAGLAIGSGSLSKSVLTVLSRYWGNHYRAHLKVIEGIVANASAPTAK